MSSLRVYIKALFLRNVQQIAFFFLRVSSSFLKHLPINKGQKIWGPFDSITLSLWLSGKVQNILWAILLSLAMIWKNLQIQNVQHQRLRLFTHYILSVSILIPELPIPTRIANNLSCLSYQEIRCQGFLIKNHCAPMKSMFSTRESVWLYFDKRLVVSNFEGCECIFKRLRIDQM